MAAITSAEILTKFSVAAAAGNTTAGTAATSLGDQISTTVWANAATLFDDISGAENAASTIDYRCVFVHNSNTANVLENAVVWFTQTAGGADVAIGVDPTAASAIGSGSTQAVTVANETTAPAGVTFSTTATSSGAGLALGNLGVGQCKAVWVRRTAVNSAALSNDGFTLNVTGDTGSL